jgi:redox-sensitive bicupin YhaK (pirin superfamily)
VIELTESHTAEVGTMRVRRALPRRTRRTVGAWCFVDHMGPVAVEPDRGVDVAPHPHIGLQTVTWLLDGEILHRDGLGSEQVIRPGQLNLMTAGHGIAHSEEATGRYRGDLHGIQLWVAMPEHTRHGEPAFEHHAELPRTDLEAGTATVLVGELHDVRSPARRDTDHVGVDVDLATGTSVLGIDTAHEHAVVVADGAVVVDGIEVLPGHLAYVPPGRDELAVTALGPARALVLGGTPFPETVVMWWNFVGRSRDEIVGAHDDWTRENDRFARVASPLPRTNVDPPPWPAAPAGPVSPAPA